MQKRIDLYNVFRSSENVIRGVVCSFVCTILDVCQSTTVGKLTNASTTVLARRRWLWRNWFMKHHTTTSACWNIVQWPKPNKNKSKHPWQKPGDWNNDLHVHSVTVKRPMGGMGCPFELRHFPFLFPSRDLSSFPQKTNEAQTKSCLKQKELQWSTRR